MITNLYNLLKRKIRIMRNLNNNLIEMNKKLLSIELHFSKFKKKRRLLKLGKIFKGFVKKVKRGKNKRRLLSIVMHFNKSKKRRKSLKQEKISKESAKRTKRERNKKK